MQHPVLAMIFVLAAIPTGSGAAQANPVRAAMLPFSVPPDSADPGLIAFGREASRFPIVLLGENGHGVREHTVTKVAMVKHLHEHHGYNVIAFESSDHDCREAQAIVGRESVGEMMRRCLLAQFHHAELVPLFEYIVATQRTARPLRLAGIDMQVQRLSRSRPQHLRDGLLALRSPLADTIAVLDSLLIDRSLQGADSLRGWLYPHLDAMRQLFDRAIVATEGDLQWDLTAVRTLLAREALRREALAADTSVPAEFYALRDEYMARSVMRHASGGSKVIVWLHNDHARYGEFAFGELRVKSTGQYLRELASDRTYSVGFLMGGGMVANNSRRPMQVATADSGSLEWHFKPSRSAAAWLSLSASPAVRDWAGREMPYSRGNEVLKLAPGAAFDALVYVDSVSVPSYRLP